MTRIKYPHRNECLLMAAALRETARRLGKQRVRFAGSYCLQLREYAVAIEEGREELHMPGLERAVDFACYRAKDPIAAALAMTAGSAISEWAEKYSGAAEQWFDQFQRRQARAAERSEAKKKAEKSSRGR